MGIDIAELVKEARHGMFNAGLVPERLALMDRAARQWGSTATPGEDLPDILAEVAQQHGVTIPCDLDSADILVTAAPAELGEHTKALADAAKILNRVGARWTMHQAGFDASNIGFNNGDLALQWTLTSPDVAESWSGTPEGAVHNAVDAFVRVSDVPVASTDSELIVMVTGVRTLADYAGVSQALARVSGVKRVSIEEAMGDTARFRVVTGGSGDTLAAART